MPLDPLTPGSDRPESSAFLPTPYAPTRGWTEQYQPPPPPRRVGRPLWFHLFLFALTAASTWYVGGATYAFWLLLILTAHEFGHYFAAKYHQVKATLPYFIPFPLPPLGTMGAVIRMSAYIPDRRALFDIAIAGPLAGMVVAVPVTIFGVMTESTQMPMQSILAGSHFGDPLLLLIIEHFALGPRPEGFELIIGPMAFAGWVGFFVTALNLLPISQLDGGHISYAVFERHSRKVAFAVFAVLGVMMVFNGPHYLLILALAWYAGIGHPPTVDDATPIGPKRQALAWLALAIFILCFTPTPIVVDWPPV